MPITNSQNAPIKLKANNVMLLDSDITFYVRENGRDTNSGQSPAVAWKTITHAYQYIKNNIVNNNFKVFLNIDEGSYLIDELVQTCILSSPVHLLDIEGENFVVVPIEEKLDKDELEKVKEGWNHSVSTLRASIEALQEAINNNFKVLSAIPRHYATHHYVTSGLKQTKEDLQAEVEKNLKAQSQSITNLQQTLEAWSTTYKNNAETVATNVGNNYKKIDDLLSANKALGQELQKIINFAESTKNTIVAINGELELNATLRQEHAKKVESVESLAEGHTITAGKLAMSVSGNTVALEQLINNCRSQFDKIIELIERHKSNLNNPHDITPNDIIFDGTTLENTLIDLYDRTRVRYQFEEKALTIPDLTNNTLNKQLQVWAASADFSNEELLIDLEGKLHKNVYLVNIPTACKIKIVNGIIQGLYADSIYVPYEFDDVKFITVKDQDSYAIALKNNSNVTLKNCLVRTGENGCVWVSSGSILQLQLSLELPDKNVPIVVKSEIGGMVDARGLSIITNIAKASIAHLGWAESNSTQDWTNVSFDGDVFIRYPKTENNGGIVVTKLKDDTYTEKED